MSTNIYLVHVYKVVKNMKGGIVTNKRVSAKKFKESGTHPHPTYIDFGFRRLSDRHFCNSNDQSV